MKKNTVNSTNNNKNSSTNRNNTLLQNNPGHSGRAAGTSPNRATGTSNRKSSELKGVPGTKTSTKQEDLANPQPEPEPEAVKPTPSKVKRRYDEFATIEPRSDYFSQQGARSSDPPQARTRGVHDILEGHSSANIVSRSGHAQHGGTIVPQKSINKGSRESKDRIDSFFGITATPVKAKPDPAPPEKVGNEGSSKSKLGMHPNTHLQNFYSYTYNDDDSASSSELKGANLNKPETKDISTSTNLSSDEDQGQEADYRSSRNNGVSSYSVPILKPTLIQPDNTLERAHLYPNTSRSCNCTDWEVRNLNPPTNRGNCICSALPPGRGIDSSNSYSDLREELVISYKEEEVPYEVWLKTQTEKLSPTSDSGAAKMPTAESSLQCTHEEIRNATAKGTKLSLNISGSPLESNQDNFSAVKRQLERCRMSEEAIKGVLEILKKLNK